MSTTTEAGRIGSQQIQAAWDAVAQGYDEFVTESHFGVAEEILARTGLRPGHRFLDVAAGSGGLSVPAARAGAQVVATDISPRMATLLEKRLSREGLDQVEVRVMDGQALDLEDDSFDVTASLYGAMLFPDLARGLSEMARVTKPGGRVCIAAFGPPPQVGFISLALGAVKSVVPEFPGLPDGAKLAFQVADPQVLRERLIEAGLRDVRVEPVTEELRFASGEQLWNYFRHSNPIGAGLVARLSEEQRGAVRARLEEVVEERKVEDGVAVIANVVNVGVGSAG